MKKFLTMVLALILIFCVCSSCTSKKEEAEYKAKVKQELDSIPIEETGYKLVETTYSDNERVQKYKNELTIDGHIYNFSKEDKNLLLKIDNQMDSSSTISFSKYGNVFKDYSMFYGCHYFDNQIFLVIYKYDDIHGWQSFYGDFLPPVLFLYNYEENTIKYCGYFEAWFEGRINRYCKLDFKIIKS